MSHGEPPASRHDHAAGTCGTMGPAGGPCWLMPLLSTCWPAWTIPGVVLGHTEVLGCRWFRDSNPCQLKEGEWCPSCHTAPVRDPTQGLAASTEALADNTVPGV